MTPSPTRAQAVEAARLDPVWLARSVFGFRPWSKQREVLESVRDNRYTVVHTCHAMGKTTLAAFSALSFVAFRPQAIGITTATTLRQVRMNLWRELHAHYGRSRIPLGGKLNQTELAFPFQMPDGTTSFEEWRLSGMTAREGDATRYQGIHAPSLIVVIDEAAGVHESVFEGLASSMAGGHARMLLIGNPTSTQGEFADRIRAGGPGVIGCDAFETPNFVFFGITIDDIRAKTWREKVTGPLPFPHLIGPEFISDRYERWCGGRQENEDDPRWLARIRGQLPGNDARSAIGLADYYAAVDEWRDIDEGHDGKKWGDEIILSSDLSRLGEDSTVTAISVKAQGTRELQRHQRQTTDRTEDDLKARVAFERSNARKVVQMRIDGDGLGAGVFDHMRRWAEKEPRPFGHPKIEVIEIRSGMAAMDPLRYRNRRAEMWFQTREALRSGFALPPDDDLRDQMTAPRWSTEDKGRIVLESKDDIRTRIGRSTDDADAVVYGLCQVPITESDVRARLKATIGRIK